MLEVVSLIADLRRLGVMLWVADEPDLDPYNTDYAEELIRSAQYARRELLTTRRRTTQGLARRKAAGVYLGHLPFGWRPVGGDRANGLEPDPAQHAALLSIYTSRATANGWTRMEALHKMTHGSLKEIVKRERNRAVVGDDLCERANKAGVSPFRAGRAYLYRGLVRCPSCGMRMMGNDREGRRYYWCSHQHRPHPYGRSVRTWTLDTALRAEVGRLVFSDRLRARIVAKLSAGSRGTSRTVLWDRRNADLDSERAFIVAQLGNRLTEAEFDERAAKIAVGRQELGARPMEAMAASAAIEEIASFIAAIPSSDDPPQEINFGNGIMREWLDRITLSDTKQPTFHWREPWRTIIAASRKPSGRVKQIH